MQLPWAFILLTTAATSGFTLSCRPNQFRCKIDGWCLGRTFVCDGEKDCLDGEDELNCPGERGMKCGPHQIRCENENFCVSEDFVCDQEWDCIEGTDERNCSDHSRKKCTGFKCYDASKCVQKSDLCDGKKDCNDGSDELKCSKRMLLNRLGLCNGFKCEDGRCISEEQVCDGRRDCFGNEDESKKACAHHLCSERCDHFCRHHYNGSVCDCRPGYKLVSGGQCRVEDECLANGCSQTCAKATTGVSGVSCSCSEGFAISGSKRCVLTDQQSGPIVLYTSGNQIRQRDDTYHESSILFKDRLLNSSLATFDMDVSAGDLYIISNTQESHEIISRVVVSSRRGRPKNVFPNLKCKILRDIAVDWLTKNIYLIDGDHDSIIVCRLTDGLCADVVKDAKHPMSFVLDPTAGTMYWISEDISNPGIFQAWMDGSQVKQLVKGVNASSLALDILSNRLYWANRDTMKLEFISLQFGSKGQLTDLLSDGVTFSMSVFGDSVYWSEMTKRSSWVHSCDKLTGENHTALVTTHQGKHIMLDVKVFQPLMQPQRNNPCWKSRCSHMCVLAARGKASCLCAQQYKLVSKTRCEIDTESFFLATSDQVFQFPETTVTENDPIAHEKVLDISGIGTMAVDVDGGAIYAVENNGEPKLIRINLHGDDSAKAYSNISVELVTSMSFDYINRVLYWLDVHKRAVMIFNPSRNETTKIGLEARTPALIPRDFAVDFLRGKIYVIMGSVHLDEFHIYVYSVNGTLLQDLVDLSPRPTQITIDLIRGTQFIYDEKDRRILYVLGSTSNAIINEVEPISQLEFWNDRLTWTERRQRGFFSARSLDWQKQHIVRGSWTTPTRAFAFTGGRLSKPKSFCAKLTGDCSHTCVSTLQAAVCICPTGMLLGPDQRTCVGAEKIQCKKEEFSCDSGYQCIPKAKKCDGVKQCDDSSDEKYCGECGEGFLKCATSAGCYRLENKCDGDHDCEDGSDEVKCSKKVVASCSNGNFQCHLTNDCIPKHRVCNGVRDCPSGDDEENCKCLHAMACPEGKCLREEDICDDYKDCKNGDDERNCGPCPPHMHRCDNLCLRKHLICDGKAQCSDKSDESKCTNTTRGLMPEFCAKKSHWCDGICIPEHRICDHIPDCSNASDEENCNFLQEEECPSHHFSCKNLKCIPRGMLCDGEDDCGDKSDESHELCRYFDDKREAESACFADEYQCADGTCISISKVCDTRNDCPDASDEGRHCARDDCSRKLCQQRCQDTPEGFQCYCDEGFKLASDHRTCEDVDECAEWGHCSHYCENTRGSFECYCGLGYELLSDNRTCGLERKDSVFLFVTHNEIRGISKRHHILDVLASGHTGEITGLTFDAVHDTVYWSEAQQVSKLPIGDNMVGAKPVVVAQRMWQPSHLSYDWVGKNMYFVDGKQEIEACSMDFTLCAHLPTPPLKKIRSLALAANEGLMFFSYHRGDSETSMTGGVFRNQMDGSDPVEIISNEAESPDHLQVDFIHRRIFVADARMRVIEHFKYNGKDRRVLLRGHRIHSFALFPDQIFWSEGNAIIGADWFTAASQQVIADDAHAYLMEFMHGVRQPTEISPCERTNCSQLCLLRSHGYTCACDAMYSLASDNKTCVETEYPGDHKGLIAGLCEPHCENGGHCGVLKDRISCSCPRGFSGLSCEIRVGRRSSVLSIILAALLILAVIGTSIIGILYLRGSWNIPGRFKLSAAYRATDLKKLVDDPNEDCGINDELDGTLSDMNVLNPIFALEVDKPDTSEKEGPPEKVAEGNLLDL